MLLLGRVLFVVGFAALALQIFESWFGWFSLPIGKENMTTALLWWACFGGMAAGGVHLMKKHGTK